MTVGYETLRAFERARWARQADVLQAWLAALPNTEPRGDALRRVFAGARVSDAAAAQLRFDLERDLRRLHAAIDGKTPSAVHPERPYDSGEAFARDEAAHTLDNAAVFLSKACVAGDLVACGAAVERAQRWIQRLHWELVDTGLSPELPLAFSAEASVMDLGSAQALASATQTALAKVRVLLTSSTAAP